MANDVKTQMVEAAVALLAVQGLERTSFSEVLAKTGGPRGSIYHHFPEGKDELIAQALALASGRALGLLETQAGKNAEQVSHFFLAMWRALLERSSLRAGCSVAAVTVATESAGLLEQAGGIFRGWRERLAELLEEGGLKKRDARRMAATLVAASEGAVIVSRAERSLEPFDLVVEQLLSEVKRLLRE